MGWFGGSKEEAPSESNFTSSDDGFSGGAQGSLGAQHEQLSAVPGAGMASLEQFAAGMQQRMAVNQVIAAPCRALLMPATPELRTIFFVRSHLVSP